MNHWCGIGRLTRDPSVSVTQGNNPITIAKFTLAVDRKYKREGEPDADFISCVAFSKTAEFVDKYFKQGSKIVVEGRWQTGSYTNKNGQKVYTNDCMVESVEFGESKKETEEKPQDGFMNVSDTDMDILPFN